MGSSKIMAGYIDDSVFNGIAEMMQELKTDMTTLQNSVTSALSNVGGAVHTVQRGIKQCTKSMEYTDVTISSITASKSVVHISTGSEYTLYNSGTVSAGSTQLGAGNNHQIIDYYLVNSTTLRVYHTFNGNNGSYFYWQVVTYK